MPKNTVYNVPKSFFDVAARLAEAGRFNVRPNYTGKKKGGRLYAINMRRRHFGS